jgi:hypothetical protein
MQKTILNGRSGRLVFLFLLLFTSFFKVSGQVVLLDKPIPVIPEGYYIAGVTDERADKGRIGQFVIRETGNKTALRPADLKGGPSAAIGQFIKRNLQQDKSLKPVIIGIKALSLMETAKTENSVDGRIRLHVSFGFQKDYGVEHLVDYQGGVQYTRYGAGNAAIEEYLRGILKGSLDYFNNWMKNNADANRKLAKNVKVSFTDYTSETEGDTIYYSPNRPLTWADFQSRARPTGVFGAQVIPGIAYTQQAGMTKGTIDVNIVMKVYLPKSASRVSSNSMDDYSLNHEQRHFDIAKIVAEQFKQKILAKKLTPDTFEAIINMQYLDSYRDLDAMQKAYDKETGHGINKSAQAEWNIRIDEELKVMISPVRY